MKFKRNELPKNDVEVMSEKIFFNLKNILDCNSRFFVYVSFSNEAKTDKIIEYLLLNNKEVFVPKIKNQTMVGVKINKNTNYKINSFGILEPSEKSTNFDNFVAIVPCLMVDKFGNRLGYGKGFYDKFLKNKTAKKIAICFDFQLSDFVPNDKHDIKMDMVITDKQIIETSLKK